MGMCKWPPEVNFIFFVGEKNLKLVGFFFNFCFKTQTISHYPPYDNVHVILLNRKMAATMAVDFLIICGHKNSKHMAVDDTK